MNKQIMRKHYEATPKETLIDILIASRQEIERLNNIINEFEERYYSLDQNMGKSIRENDTREDFVKMKELFIKAKRK